MSEDSLLLIESLKSRIEKLFDEFGKIKRKNEALKEEIVVLQNRKEQLENELATLNTKYDNLKLAKAFESGYGDPKVARQRINKIVREIDKCMALLNE